MNETVPKWTREWSKWNARQPISAPVVNKRNLPRDRRALVDFLNFDFSVYRKMSVETVPSGPLREFLIRYRLNTEAGYETAKQIQEELCGNLFLEAPDGERELGPLTARAGDYQVKTILVPQEDNKGIETAILAPENPREDLYQVIISAVDDKTFWSLHDDCKNCHRCYWRKSKFCSPECGREYNSKTAAERMRRHRSTHGYKLKQRKSNKIKVIRVEGKSGRKGAGKK